MTTAVGTRQIVMGALQGGIALAYPLIIWLGLARFEPRVLALIVAGVAALRFVLGRSRAQRSGGEMLRALGMPALLIVATVGAVVIWNDAIGLLLMPVAMSLAFLFAFGFSLWRGPPMVERFARLQVDTLSEAEVIYCRRVTWIWCGFFIGNAAIAGALAGARALDAWALYTGLVSYLLMGTLFAAEYLYRHWRFRRYVGAFSDPVLMRVFPPRESPRGGSGGAAWGEAPPTLRPETQWAEGDSERWRVEWRVPAQLACWPGHFPEQALLPGVLQLEWIMRALESWQGIALRPDRIERLKFKLPVFPGDVVLADLRADSTKDGARVYRVELFVRDELATTLQISISDPTPTCSDTDEKRGNESELQTTPDRATSEGAAGRWPDPAALLPHAGNMLWLDSVTEHDEGQTVCRVRTQDLGAFRDRHGGAGPWIALEWMAQTVAAHDGVRRHAAGDPIRPGMLLGTKKLEIFGGAIEPESEFAVHARHVFGGDLGMVSYDCEVLEADSGRLRAKARLACRVGTAGAPIA